MILLAFELFMHFILTLFYTFFICFTFSEADFNIHCNGKKHKNNERIKNEQDAAAASVLVRGVKGKL